MLSSVQLKFILDNKVCNHNNSAFKCCGTHVKPLQIFLAAKASGTNDVILREGEKGEDLYVLDQGQVLISKSNLGEV